MSARTDTVTAPSAAKDDDGIGRHREVLAAAIEAIGGAPREGQEKMADAVAHALEGRCHLLVQAGTGTGKSLGYLAPALVHAQRSGHAVVVATATLALQAQLATKDIPAAAAAVAAVTGREPVAAIVKGRRNYACLLRALEGGAEEQEALIGGEEINEAAHAAADPDTALGAEVIALREWIGHERAEHGLADRDDAPRHSARAWAQVSISSRECLGSRCPFYDECFTEQSRARARQADVIVTNHALFAIDALNQRGVIPEHDAVIIDEAHELTARVTGAASQELSPQRIERAARRSAPWLNDQVSTDLIEAADSLLGALALGDLGRVTSPQATTVLALARLRELSRSALSALTQRGPKAEVDTERAQAQAGMQEVFESCERMAALADTDVVWVSESRFAGRQLNVAPLSVAGLLRHAILSRAVTVLTSATLAIGGSFEAMAGQVGLRSADRVESVAHIGSAGPREGAEAPDEPEDISNWRGIDVGSPFDYAHQAILYIASAAPRPAREGMAQEVLNQIAQLIWAAHGRTLGLFSSQRNAELAARHVRAELPSLPLLCQGEMQLPELTRRFTADPATSLFGTMSLWQGIDVPGESCQLVIIDRIPFPRPDDPLSQARQQAVNGAGGNGFMRIAASHAALLLAQGAGRLIRSSADRGVVAVLDPRLVTARYGPYLQASLPPFWRTSSLDVAVNALRRLGGHR
ncbi:ATP-dependent DNA helicase DinG [Propionibacterium cyclohexanicum]|uniref:ATP-dependent helicase DinG n=1 Tax=Propionibacterium cyclohexanicum TaxID=64702 RepID=A0A1H9QRT7_9ACTN|nr:ATP-dependent DNA helicase [Propionibacterium cyclohexanicum]SER62945.1 ATP-dependent DNA helicase DinG [Propionibacterium cyclohexanicum]